MREVLGELGKNRFFWTKRTGRTNEGDTGIAIYRLANAGDPFSFNEGSFYLHPESAILLRQMPVFGGHHYWADLKSLEFPEKMPVSVLDLSGAPRSPMPVIREGGLSLVNMIDTLPDDLAVSRVLQGIGEEVPEGILRGAEIIRDKIANRAFGDIDRSYGILKGGDSKVKEITQRRSRIGGLGPSLNSEGSEVALDSICKAEGFPHAGCAQTLGKLLSDLRFTDFIGGYDKPLEFKISGGEKRVIDLKQWTRDIYQVLVERVAPARKRA